MKIDLTIRFRPTLVRFRLAHLCLVSFHADKRKIMSISSWEMMEEQRQRINDLIYWWTRLFEAEGILFGTKFPYVKNNLFHRLIIKPSANFRTKQNKNRQILKSIVDKFCNSDIFSMIPRWIEKIYFYWENEKFNVLILMICYFVV